MEQVDNSAETAQSKVEAGKSFGSGFEGTSGKEHLEKRQLDGYYRGLTLEQYLGEYV